MAQVEADDLVVRERISEVELVAADHVGLTADPEELALDRVPHLGRRVGSGVNFVQ